MEELLSVNVVAGCVVRDGDKYLLVQERKAIVHGLWSLPGGRVNKGEELETAAKREVLEETGFVVEILSKVGVAHYSLDQPVLHAFLAEIRGDSLSIKPDEILDATWFTLDEIRQMSLDGKLRAAWVLESIEASKSS